MKYYQLLKILDQTDLAPEDLAPTIGVSNMTLRRWRKKPKNESLPVAYEATIREGLFKLIIQGRLQGNTQELTKALEETNSNSFEACLKSLGVTDPLQAADANNEETTTVVLAQIGHGKEHREEVDSKRKEISAFKSFGKSWSKHIAMLLKVIQSDHLTLLDKVVAYGALFYLLCPFDLIPDSIPVVGYLDDFAMLAVAAAFYMRNYPQLKSETR